MLPIVAPAVPHFSASRAAAAKPVQNTSVFKDSCHIGRRDLRILAPMQPHDFWLAAALCQTVDEALGQLPQSDLLKGATPSNMERLRKLSDSKAKRCRLGGGVGTGACDASRNAMTIQSSLWSKNSRTDTAVQWW